MAEASSYPKTLSMTSYGHDERKLLMIDPIRRRTLGLLGIGGVALAASRLGGFGALAHAEPGMHMREIPSSGEKLPVIGLGTWQTFDVDDSTKARAPLKEVLAAFAAMGGALVDSSPMYRRSEQVLGDLAAELDLHEHLFVATKVWTRGKQDGIDQMRASMAALRTEPIDLIQVHNLVDVDKHLDTLAEWREQGRTRYIGITHYTARAHDEVVRVASRRRVDFIQINYSVAEREAEQRLLPFAKERGIAVIANRPFASGALFQSLRDKPLPDYAAAIDCRSWAQIMLKFTISHPAVSCVIPATSKIAHLRDNMQAGYSTLPDPALRQRIAAEFA